MSNTFTTSKGSVLNLMKLKGKDYMPVAARLVWLADDVSSYVTTTEFLSLTDDRAVAKVTLTILDKDGRMVKQVQDIKSENKKDFADFAEKAVTGALGRCLAQAGFGTQFAVQDLDELSAGRIVDTPQDVPVKANLSVATENTSTNEETATLAAAELPVKKSKWKAGKKEATTNTAVDDNW